MKTENRTNLMIYRHKHKYLEDSLTTCPFNKATEVPLYPAGAYDLLGYHLLTMFTALGMHSLLWNEPCLQS